MQGSFCRSIRASLPGPPSFSWQARSISPPFCSVGLGGWCGSCFLDAIWKHDWNGYQMRGIIMMPTLARIIAMTCAALVAGALVGIAPASAQQAPDGKLKAIASFSILGDLVKNVGGDRVEVGTLVGANGNAHVYAPSPADAKKVADARIVFVNGLGFE